MRGRKRLRALLFLAAALMPKVASAASGGVFEGVVFTDANANGLREAGEAPLAGIAVSNGRQVVVTGADGGYRLPQRQPAFVSVTCPDDGRCDSFYRRGSGDFAVVPEPQPDDFFFVQISDLHGYRAPEDLRALPSPEDIPWWMPRYAVGWYLLRTLTRMYPERERDEIVESLREALLPHREVAQAWGPTVTLEYFDAAMDSQTGLIDPAADIAAALDEVEALGPSFVVNTGDFILDGNEVSPEVAAAWFTQYDELLQGMDLPVYTTIGNNELVATERDDIPPTDRSYGKGLFRRYRGPTHFSFDRGRFHFVALDTHSRQPTEDGRTEWEFGIMEPAVRHWLEADLAAAQQDRVVVLNHEPFHEARGWGLVGGRIGQDEGIFDAHRVAYALAGHVHMNGVDDIGHTTHITTASLSGFRWVLPASFDVRGYRLFYAKGERLYSAFKRLGEPALGFVSPMGDASIHPGSKSPADPSALSGEVEVVVVAADARGPFTSLELHLNGEPLTLDRWGDYFARARFDAGTLGPGGSTLLLTARDAAGSKSSAALAVARAQNP